ncbi:ABC transporter ATP-binding protein [Bacillus fonticola]|uniref:ABC transporter ATP-binding protein n=1 Tax=Bacillus fonticola TaxID=2728853 RepID=UPI0014748C8F|nr:ABC-F type ribosomal protection protein [Bacillus fonticola]
MIVLQVLQLDKFFGAEPILQNIKLEIKARERVALVGRNGTGKSTLLKIIAGKLSYDRGQIITPKESTIGYLAQDTGLESTRTIWEEMMTVFSSLHAMEKKLRMLESKMSDPNAAEDPAAYSKLLEEYDRKQETFKQQGGYVYEAETRSVLHGLRFTKEHYDTPISSLSGGQKTRLALGKLLLTKPDLCILDEPTNHLDIETLSWLEGYLQHYFGAILVVSHDRYFLDAIVGTVYELSRSQCTRYHGNYSNFLTQKAERAEQQWKEFEKQQEEIAKTQDFIQKNLARASTTKRAQSRRKSLERMDVLEKPDGDEKSASISFTIAKQSGNEVLSIQDVTTGYNGTALLEEMNLRITRGQRIALLGPNGIGKSTLLKTIVGDLPLLSGSIRLGSNVSLSYYDQEQTGLHDGKSVLNELWDDYPTFDEKDIRTVLGRFLFTGDDVLKEVHMLSGGEKARLSLAKLMMQQANFLVLDEPTNHLDLDSKEVLEDALQRYPGTILFVSHDRYFMNRMATTTVELERKEMSLYLGNYDYYVEKKAELLAMEEEGMRERKEPLATPHQESPPLDNSKQSYEQQKESKRQKRQLERQSQQWQEEIDTLEEAIQSLEQAMLTTEVLANHQQLVALQQEVDEKQQALNHALSEWEKCEEELLVIEET